MDGGHGCVPVCFVCSKVAPEVRGREFGGNDHGTASVKGSEETSEKTVDVEQRHHEHGAVCRAESVCGLDVGHRAGEVSMGEGDLFS